MITITEPISNVIWDIKYRYRLKGKVIDETREDTWLRVAKAVAGAEVRKARGHWQREFYRILAGYRFLPGGRILAGAGTKHHVTLFNCFVMDIAHDSLSSIFKALEEGAITLQQGGGVGYDFSVLRPRGDLAKRTGIASSGPVSFMQIWDSACGVLLSTGVRRGAMMGVMRCDHPDIIEFITAKRDPQMLRHFNVSVMVTDAFMTAVKEDAEWALVFPLTEDSQDEVVYRQWGKSTTPVVCRVYRRVRARELWELIIKSAYDYAEPGVLFGGTINRLNNLWYGEQINATNPCGEIPLPAYGACDLGALNLTQFVIAPFQAQAKFDWHLLEETTTIATRFLDNVIDVSRYPLKAQQNIAFATRRIGLGVTGLADALVMLGLRYDSPEATQFASDLMRKVADMTWQTSIELAQEKGPFPLFEPAYLEGAFVRSLSPSLQSGLAKQGVRNSHHNTIAPAGTISLFANNISNGIEPIFRAECTRHMRMERDEIIDFHVKDYAYHLWSHMNHHDTLPPSWVDASALSPDAHLAMQAAMQPFIDNAISKTINLPADFPFAKLADVYSKAYALGLKGCTVFRPNPVTGSVLEEKTGNEGAADRCCQQ